jgi:hypothetical protein
VSTEHRIKEFIKYKRKAKGRHGIHSPFVYSFIDNVLKKRTSVPNLFLVTKKEKKLINRIISYFGCRNILWVANPHGEAETYISITHEDGQKASLTSEVFRIDAPAEYPQPDLLLIDLNDPSDWKPAFEKYGHRLKEDSLVLVSAPHQTKKHSEAWAELHSLAGVKLSIDIFRLGLLFFRDEFKEKQHFILKY